MQYGFYFDQFRCMGCETCLVACKDWNGVKPGPARWRRLIIKEEGNFPSVVVSNMVFSCNHCENPACIPVCPVDAIYKREEDGIVIADRNKCIACKLCLAKCPYGAPQFADDKSEPKKDPNWKVDHPVQRCRFCWDRLAVGKKPTCVDACPQRAIDAGPINELKKKYPDAKWGDDAFGAIAGFPDPAKDPAGKTLPSGSTNPSIGVKPKR